MVTTHNSTALKVSATTEDIFFLVLVGKEKYLCMDNRHKIKASTLSQDLCILLKIIPAVCQRLYNHGVEQ